MQLPHIAREIVEYKRHADVSHNCFCSLDKLRKARCCGQAVVASQAVSSQDDRAIIYNLLDEVCNLIRPDRLAVIHKSLIAPAKPKQVYGKDSVLLGKLDDVITPVVCRSPKAMYKNYWGP